MAPMGRLVPFSFGLRIYCSSPAAYTCLHHTCAIQVENSLTQLALCIEAFPIAPCTYVGFLYRVPLRVLYYGHEKGLGIFRVYRAPGTLVVYTWGLEWFLYMYCKVSAYTMWYMKPYSLCATTIKTERVVLDRKIRHTSTSNLMQQILWLRLHPTPLPCAGYRESGFLQLYLLHAP